MARELHVKDGGVWRRVNQLFVKEGGVWRTVTEGHVKEGGVWQQFYEGVFEANITIASDVTNYNLRDELVTLGYGGGVVKVNVTVTINAGVTVGSTTPTLPAFDVDDGTVYPVGSTVTIVNNGKIIGAGGAGGDGGDSTVAANVGSPGEDGGTAVSTLSTITITNNGTIAGGSGGGGGGASTNIRGGGGGGGGDGSRSAPGGIGGLRDTGVQDGSNGNASDAAVSPGLGGARGGTDPGNGGDGGGVGTSTVEAARYGLMGFFGQDSTGGAKGGASGDRGRFLEGYDVTTFTTRGTLLGSHSPHKSIMTMISEMGWSSYNKLCIDLADATCYNDETVADQTVADLSPSAFVLRLGDSASVETVDPSFYKSVHEYSYFSFSSGDKLEYSSGTLTALNNTTRAAAKALLWAVCMRDTDALLFHAWSGLAAARIGLSINSSSFPVLLRNSSSHASTVALADGASPYMPRIIVAAIDENGTQDTVRFVHSSRTTVETVNVTFANNTNNIAQIAVGVDDLYGSTGNFASRLFGFGIIEGVAMTNTELETFYQKLADRFVA